MGLGDEVSSNDQKGGFVFIASAVSCSICLEAVTDSGDRSIAKLQCGHEFHLDCIGSAFNAKGVMQCPNCRKIEKGQWLYANGYHSFSEFSIDDWAHEDDPYDQSYSEMHYGVHWCPFRGYSRLSPSFEEGESPSTAYQDLLGHRAMFAEHSTASAARSCPFVALHAYIQPLQPSSSSNGSENAADVPALHHHWAGLSGPAPDLHYHTWEHQSPPFSQSNGLVDGSEQTSPPATLRSVRTEPDGLSRTGAVLHPFLLSHGHSSRTANSFVSSAFRPYSGNSRAHAHVHGLHGYPQPSASLGMRGPVIAPIRRSSGTRNLAPIGTTSPTDHTGFYILPSGSASRNVQEGENSSSRNYERFYPWERDQFAPAPWIPFDSESHVWGPFYYNQTSQGAGGSDTGTRWHRSSERRTQGRPESTHQPVHHSGMPPPFL